MKKTALAQISIENEEYIEMLNENEKANDENEAMKWRRSGRNIFCAVMIFSYIRNGRN